MILSELIIEHIQKSNKLSKYSLEFDNPFFITYNKKHNKCKVFISVKNDTVTYSYSINVKDYDHIGLLDIDKLDSVEVSFKMKSIDIDSNVVLSNFKKIINNIDKLHEFLYTVRKHIKNIKPKMINYIKTDVLSDGLCNTFSERDLNLHIYMSKVRYLYRNRYKFRYINIFKKDELEQLETYAYYYGNVYNISYKFKYDVKDDKVILESKVSYYNDNIDMTSVIRLEKLKNINSLWAI
jgi:hypothetical protein